MDKRTKAGKLPLWSRLLIGFVSLGVASLLVAMIQGTIVVKQTFEHAFEPTFVGQVASRMAKFPEPLPDGYAFNFGLDLGAVRLVSLVYKKNDQYLLLINHLINAPSPSEKKSLNTGELLKKYYEIGLNTTGAQARFKSVISEGAWTIQGQRIPYIIGDLEDTPGKGLVACRVDPVSSSATIFYAYQPGASKEDFNMRILTDLLQHMTFY